MAQIKWSAKHVRSLADLPDKLTIGRAYWVDDEHYIVIDHGQGPVIYGNRTGQQGQPGEPIPILQAQIDSLTEAAFSTAFWIDELNQTRKKSETLLQQQINLREQESKSRDDSLSENISLKENESVARDEALSENISARETESKNRDETLQKNIDTAAQNLSENISARENESLARDEALSENISFVDNRSYENFSLVMQQLDLCAQAIISLTNITTKLCENLRGTEATLLKLILDNEAQSAITPFEQITSITTDDGYSWDITPMTNDDGETVYIFNLKS